MAQKVFRTGNSLAVTLPAPFTSAVGIRAGDRVKVREERGRGRIVYQFSGVQQMLLDERFMNDTRRRAKRAKSSSR